MTDNSSSMKKTLNNKRPENKNQIFRKTHSENNKLKTITKSLQKETFNLKRIENHIYKEEFKQDQ